MASPPTPKQSQLQFKSEDRKLERVRVTVPVSVEVLEVFQRLAKASGRSVGRSMGEWLEDTVQGAVFLAETVEKAREKPRQAIQDLHGYAMAITSETGSFLDRMRKGGVVGAEGTHEGGGAAPKEPLTPPSSNTGGKVPQKGTKTRKGPR